MGKLSAYHLSLGQIMKAVQSVAVDVPDVKGRTKENKLVIFGVKNAIESVDDVKNVIVAQYMGSPIYLRDVAKVSEGVDIQNFKTATVRFKEDANATSLGKERSQVTLTVAKLAGTNAVFVAEDVIEMLKKHDEELAKEGIGYLVTRNYGERANEAVNELMNHLLITIVIIALMLVFALGWKESIIVTFTVPAMRWMSC